VPNETTEDPHRISERQADLRVRAGSWDHWRLWMERSSRSESGRRAGLWALGVLERHLGSDWLARSYAAEGGVLPEVAAAGHFAIAYAELLRIAGYLERAQGMPGFARVRTALRRDLRDDLRLHSLLQLEVGVLAASNGAQAAFEQVSVNGRTPIDVRLTSDECSLGIETFVVLPDDQMKAGRDLADRLSEELLRIRFRHDVYFVGRVSESLDEDVLPGIVAAVEEASCAASATGAEQRVDDPNVDLRVVPQALVESGMNFEMPAGTPKGWDRTTAILRKKADQTIAAGATWLRADLRDTMWQLSPWAQAPLPEKAIQLASAVRGALADKPEVRGVVLSSGVASALHFLSGETTLPRVPCLAMRRDLGGFRGRETVIIPLVEGAQVEADLWYGIYDPEPGWLDAELDHYGHPRLLDLAAVDPYWQPGDPSEFAS